jgi:hypothetical protein
MKAVTRSSLRVFAPLAASAVIAGSATGATLPPQIHTVAGGGPCTVIIGTTVINGNTVNTFGPCDNAPATSVPIYGARSVAALPGGGFLFVDSGNHLIRQVSPLGTVTTVAGNGSTTDADGTLAVNSGLNDPVAIAPLPGGGFLITEHKGSVVRMVSPGTPDIAMITTIAGTGTAGNNGLLGQATSTKLNYPTDAEPTADGNVLIADTYNNYIREVSLASGTIATIAGGGSCSDGTTSCEGQPASAVGLNHPDSVSPVQGGAGGYLVAEYDRSTIRAVSSVSPSGTFTTVAGTGSPGFGGDGGAATAAQLNFPEQVTSTADGGFLIADTNNERIRQVSPSGTITTIAGNGASSFAGDGGDANAASLQGPAGVSPTADGGFLIADAGNSLIRQITIPPTSNVALTPGGADGMNGWYIRSAVHATISSATAVKTRCALDPPGPPPAYDAMPSAPCAYLGTGADISGDGTHTLYAASVNAAGDKELPVAVTVKLDAAVPTVDCGKAPSFLVGARGPSVSATVNDAVSGPISPTVSIPADTSVIGSRTVLVTGINNAGHSTVQRCPYNVLPLTLSPTPVLLWAFTPGPASSTVKQLVMTHIPAHAAVNVTCSGAGCPFRTARGVQPKQRCEKRCRASLGRTHTIDLARLFAHGQLVVGTHVTVSVTKPRTIGRTILFTIRAGQDPSDRVACLKPGWPMPATGAERSCSPSQ